MLQQIPFAPTKSTQTLAQLLDRMIEAHKERGFRFFCAKITHEAQGLAGNTIRYCELSGSEKAEDILPPGIVAGNNNLFYIDEGGEPCILDKENMPPAYLFRSCTKWQPISMEALERSQRNSLNQSSASGRLGQDIADLILRRKTEEGDTFAFFAVTITSRPAPGKLGGTTYWHMKGLTEEELSLEARPGDKNVLLFSVTDGKVSAIEKLP